MSDSAKTVSVKKGPAMEAVRAVAAAAVVSLSGSGQDRWDSGNGEGSVPHEFSVTVTGGGS